MAKNPTLSDDELYEVAIYLAQPEVETEIHAEMPQNHRHKFEKEYSKLTGGCPLPPSDSVSPFYVWPPGTNKYGTQLRIYFKDIPPTPPIIKSLYTDKGKWYAKKKSYRINHSNLVYQLLSCGFVLGNNAAHGVRIKSFMKKKFPYIP